MLLYVSSLQIETFSPGRREASWALGSKQRVFWENRNLEYTWCFLPTSIKRRKQLLGWRLCPEQNCRGKISRLLSSLNTKESSRFVALVCSHPCWGRLFSDASNFVSSLFLGSNPDQYSLWWSQWKITGWQSWAVMQSFLWFVTGAFSGVSRQICVSVWVASLHTPSDSWLHNKCHMAFLGYQQPHLDEDLACLLVFCSILISCLWSIMNTDVGGMMVGTHMVPFLLPVHTVEDFTFKV